MLTQEQEEYRKSLGVKETKREQQRQSAQAKAKWIEKRIAENKRFNAEWERYKKTAEFDRLTKAMRVNPPYCENIAYRIFYAGFWQEPFIK